MMMTAMACREENMSFAAVHDSFWTHPCDVDRMNVLIRYTMDAMRYDLIALADSFCLISLSATVQLLYNGAMNIKLPYMWR